MKTFVLSKSSWHYKLANLFGGMRYVRDTDVCEYTKTVIAALFLSTMITFFGIILLILSVHMLLGVGFSIWMGAWFFSDLGIMGLIIYGLVGGGLMIKAADGKYSEWKDRRRENYEPKPDGFLKVAYSSWKDKYCVRIEIVNDMHDENLRAGQ